MRLKKLAFAGLVIGFTTPALATMISHRLPVVENNVIHFWFNDQVPAGLLGELHKKDLKSSQVLISSSELQEKILKSYGLGKMLQIVDLSNGKGSTQVLASLNFVRDSGDCLYKYKDYFEANLDSSNETSKELFLGVALPSSMKTIDVSKEVAEQIASYFANNKDLKRFKSMSLDFSAHPFVLGIRDLGQDYFITVSPMPEMGTTYFVFKLEKGKIEKADTLEFPPCGS